MGTQIVQFLLESSLVPWIKMETVCFTLSQQFFQEFIQMEGSEEYEYVCMRKLISAWFIGETCETTNVLIKSEVNKLWNIHIAVSNLYANKPRDVM